MPQRETREAGTSCRETSEDLLARGRRCLGRGDAEAAEPVLWTALRTAHESGEKRNEIAAAALLGELLVTQSQAEAGLQLLHHCRELLDALPQQQRERMRSQRQVVDRYLAELEPIDPRFVEWAD